ncbi:MAG: DUF4880 domain-containing protein, partial [Novosphingobium sp.]
MGHDRNLLTEDCVSNDPVSAAAMEWFVRLRDDAPTAEDLQNFAQWRDADETHAAAYEELEALWSNLDEITPPEPLCGVWPESTGASPNHWRRWAGGLIVASLALVLFSKASDLRTWALTDEQTRTGDAMRQLAGVSLVQGSSSLETTFYSRGFAITNIQVDGGAPMATLIGNGASSGYFPQIDMSVYDHVELLRGAAGQFGAYGDPGGTINLVRKKPLDHAQFTLEAQAGSWDTYRIVADATSPLALDGALRGRLVMTYQNNHYFYNTAKDDEALV